MGIITTYYCFIGKPTSITKREELSTLISEDDDNTSPLFQHEGETYFLMEDMGGYIYCYKCFYYIGESDEQSDLTIDYKKFPKNINESCNFYCISIMT